MWDSLFSFLAHKCVQKSILILDLEWFPKFTKKRLNKIFSALAFCNNSEPQKKRRQILQKFTLPHFPSDLGSYLDQLCLDECQYLVEHIKQTNSEIIDLKPLVTKACANIFNRYFCSSERRSYNNEDFSTYCQNFDQVSLICVI